MGQNGRIIPSNESTLDHIFKEMLPFYTELPDMWRKRMLSSCQLNRFDKGTMLHAGEEQCSGLFVLVNGRVRAYMATEEGKNITLFRLMERDVCIFSASCLMNNITFDVHILAETDVEAVRIPARLFDQLSKEEISVSNYTNELMESRMSDVMWVLEQIVFMSFDKRLGLFLLEQFQLEDTDTISMTQEEIAANLGSAREVVSRMLKYFAKEGIVEVMRGGVKLVSREKLMKITEK